MTKKSIAEEVEGRIIRHLSKADRKLEVSLIWSGYVGALLEWGSITPSEHDKLREVIGLDERFDEEMRIVFLDC